jgi:hypothetical protein
MPDSDRIFPSRSRPPVRKLEVEGGGGGPGARLSSGILRGIFAPPPSFLRDFFFFLRDALSFPGFSPFAFLGGPLAVKKELAEARPVGSLSQAGRPYKSLVG